MERTPSLSAISSAIGVFDSGVGGLSVLDKLVERFPEETFLYLGDTRHMPYGDRQITDLSQLIQANLRWLMAHQPLKALVIACNTAMTVIHTDTTGIFDRLLLGRFVVDPMSPVVKMLSELMYRQVAIMATPVTIASYQYPEVIREKRPDMDVTQVSGKDLAVWIETGRIHDPAFPAYLDELLIPLRQKHFDALVLGCTHYPHVASYIQKILGSTVAVLDPADAMADALTEFLQQNGLAAPSGQVRPGDHQVTYYVTGIPKEFSTVAANIPLKHLRILPMDVHQTATTRSYLPQNAHG